MTSDKNEGSRHAKKKKHGDFSKFIKTGPAKSPRASKKTHQKALEARDKKKLKPEKQESRPNKFKPAKKKAEEGIRLNRYIANAGICSRREADELITAGVIKINGETASQLGTKVFPGDKVQYDGRTISSERHVYLLLNKPKGFITTTDDPYERKTVMSLVENACKERIYPVGRLDRDTTGLLLFTNDGELAKKLTHPKHGIKKLYHVQLDKALSTSDLMSISEGTLLEDGMVKPDTIAWDKGEEDKKSIGIELHSGKNRIVRRIFEHYGYKVVRLDRVSFAGLSKKDLPRGNWRFLKKHEISFLKML
jgi:23S rRNA pseudouridine2605 synthase